MSAALVFTGLTGAAGFCAELELPPLFAQDMILQRDQPVPVWGRAEPGTPVTVEFAGQRKTTLSAADGRWKLLLDPMPASSQPRTFTVSQKPDVASKVFENVLVGDVWLCSGQSNMAMSVDGPSKWLYIGGIANAKAVVRDSANPLLRQFYVDWKTDIQPQQNCTGKWTVAGPETTALFSATGYFFARTLQERLHVPVAILNASFGGSSIESWISRETQTAEAEPDVVSKMNEVVYAYEHHEELLQHYCSQVAAWEKQFHREAPAESLLPAADSDKTGWELKPLPAPLSKLGCPHGGVVWLQRDFEIPVEWGTAWRLDFPACKAYSEIHLNGVKIFDATAANQGANRAARPAFQRNLAKVGQKNTLAIRLHGYTGNSGITGSPFALIPFDPKFAPIPMQGEWLVKVQTAFDPLAPNAGPPPVAPVKPTLHWSVVSAHYNAMIHPILPFGIRGVAWYQGESNVGNPHYKKHLQMLVRDWRKQWGRDTLPFLVCQLPAYGAPSTVPGDSPWAACREAQAGVLELPHTGIANLIDTCDDGDLHPLNKQDAGTRLAHVALAQLYGITDAPASGPVFDSVSFQGEKTIVNFRHTEKGLSPRKLPTTYRPNLRKPEVPEKPLELPSPESEVQGFALCEMRPQSDGSLAPHWAFANAKIDGHRVVLWAPGISKPEAVRYAWADHPVCNLVNSAGLPAFPFRTDSFPVATPKTK